MLKKKRRRGRGIFLDEWFSNFRVIWSVRWIVKTQTESVSDSVGLG